MMKIVIVAGGSGGHIYPALTLAKELINRGHRLTIEWKKNSFHHLAMIL